MKYEQEIEQIEYRTNLVVTGAIEKMLFRRLLTLAKKMQEHIKDLKMLMVCYQVYQTENDWIPCSERLPEKFGCYLVTAKRNGKIMPRTYECHYTPIGKQWDYLRDDKGYVFGAEIIAWMITPIPYNL